MPYSAAQTAEHEKIMTQGEPVAVELTARRDRRATGEVRLYRLSDAERSKRSLGAMLKFFAIAVLAVLVPPHGAWTLLCVLIGIGSYVKLSREAARLLGGEATCPSCGKTQYLGAEPVEFPFMHFCSECKTRSIVNRADQMPA